MNKASKAVFSKTSLKELTDPLDLDDQPCSSLVIDDRLILDIVKWKQSHTLQEIADSYIPEERYVQCLGSHSQMITVVLMATAAHQNIMITFGIPRTPAVIYRFDLI